MVEEGCIRLAEAALSPSVRLLCDVRLGILTLMFPAVALAGKMDLWWVLAFSLAAVANLAILRSRSAEGSWAYRYASVVVLGDAFGTAALTSKVFVVAYGVTSMVVAYLLLSALLVGAVEVLRVVVGWCLVVVVVPLSALFFLAGEASGIKIGAMVCVAGFAHLGMRMARQVERVEHLAREVAEARATTAAAQERLMIARDLHDTMAKSAAGVRMLAEALNADLRERGAESAPVAQALFDAADATSREARAVLDGLRTGSAKDLRECLAEDARRWSARTGMDLRLKVEGEPVVANSSQVWHLQRVLGELLGNVEKHAQARHVRLLLCGERGSLRMDVEDDGLGPPESLLEHPSALAKEGHYGMAGICERLQNLGGELVLGKGESGGTAAHITVPFLAV